MVARVAKLSEMENNPIVLKFPVKTGDTVYARSEQKSREVKLGAELAVGGEGYIYETHLEGFVAKVFRTEKLDSYKEQKIKLMAAKKLNYEGICFPIAPLYNKEHKFVGFLMRKALGVEIQRSVFLPPVFKRTFPHWQKKDLVQLCLSILEKIKYLHDQDIVLGDLNPGNILIVSPTEVYFVDTDSYQVDGFPCPVGMPNFIAPELQYQNFRYFLRTKGHDNFAIATLLFMLMLPGQKPYAKRGGSGNLLQNIKQMDFPYEVDGSDNDKIPNGMWGSMWKQLNPKLRIAFYHAFHESGIHNCEQTRYNVDDWIEKFRHYLLELERAPLAIFPREQAEDPSFQDADNEPILMYGLMDVTENVERACSCLFYLGESTKTQLAKILKGNNKALSDLPGGSDAVSFFGSLQEMSQPEINHLLDYLLIEDYMALGGGRKKVLTVTEKGAAYVLKKFERGQ